MKKLMTMIAAVATAFGLYAADPTYLSGTSFEGTNGGALSDVSASLTELNKGNGAWVIGGEANVVSFLAEGIESYPQGQRSTLFPASPNNYFLKLKTGSEEVTRYAIDSSTKYDVAADGNYYFDSVVQLSAFDEDPSESITGAKLALWLQEDEDAGTTNLMIKVGNGDVIVADGDYSNLLGNWARVTIKALPISASQIGFVLFIDTTAVVVDPTKAVTPTLNAIAQAYQKDGVLIVSTATTDAQKISNVGFKGTGLVDDIVFTQTLPGTWAEDPSVVEVKLNQDAEDIVTAVSTNGVLLTLPAIIEKGVTVHVTASDAYMDKDYANVQESFEIKASDFTAAVATFNGEKYATMAEVTDAAYTATGTDNTIVILANQVNGFTFSNNVEDASVTLDLNGKTVIGEEGCDAAILVESGALIITVTEGGSVDGTACTETGVPVAVQPNNGSFTIRGGSFIGAVNGGKLAGGTYDADPRDTNEIVSGYKAKEVEPGVWAVVEDTSVDFTVTAGENSKVAQVLVNGADVTLAPPDKLEAGETYKVTFEAESGYMFAPGTEYVFEGEAEDEAIEITGPDAALIVATVTDADGAAMGDYATLTEALTAATNLCTVTLLQDATTDFIKNGPFAADQYPDGLTIDLNEKVWTVDLKSDNKYALQLSSGNKFTFKNGDLKVADNEWATLTTMFQNYADLTVANVDIDATNLKGTNGYWDCAAVFAVMNGNVQITGSTSVTGTDGYLLSVGNHAGEYQSRAVTINTTGALAGDFLFAGGAVTYVNGTLDTDAAYYYGSATNAPSSTTGYPGAATIFAITDLTGFNLTTGVGEVPVAPTVVSTYKRCGQLYADVATAKAAAQTSDDIVLFTDYELAADETFVNAVAVVAPAKITLGTYKLTAPNGDLADEAFVIPEDKKIKKTENMGSFTYELENAVVPPINPGHSSDPYETQAEAEAAAAKTAIKPADNFELAGDALTRWQGLFVNQVYQDGDGKYRFAPVMNADGSNAVAQAEATLTKAIKVADIAAATEGIETMELTGAEPGFYYTLFKSDDVTTVLDVESHDKGNSDKQAKADGKVTFTNVTKPSAAAGFFSVKAFDHESFTK